LYETLASFERALNLLPSCIEPGCERAIGSVSAAQLGAEDKPEAAAAAPPRNRAERRRAAARARRASGRARVKRG
jgi:hypothetical protein